jgi:ribosomal protein L16 Arg81 hydroxylase
VHPRPLRDQPWTDHRAEVEQAAKVDPLLETTLSPGDCLYLPRGYLHSATALGGVSTHLTIGVHTWNRHHLAQELLSAALSRSARDPEVRASLPLGADLADPAALAADVELVRAALHRALDDLDAGDLTTALVSASRGSQRAAPVGPLAQHSLAGSLREDTALRVRPHLAPTLDEGSVPAVLRSRAGTVRVDGADLDAVRSFLGAGASTAGHLGLDLARRLVLAGIAVAA